MQTALGGGGGGGEGGRGGDGGGGFGGGLLPSIAARSTLKAAHRKLLSCILEGTRDAQRRIQANSVKYCLIIVLRANQGRIQQSVCRF